MPHCGALKQANPYRLETAATSTTGVNGTVTVITIRRDRISEVESLPGSNLATDRSIQSGVARLIFHVNPTVGGSILFKLSQGTIVVEETVTSDATFVFDVA